MPRTARFWGSVASAGQALPNNWSLSSTHLETSSTRIFQKLSLFPGVSLNVRSKLLNHIYVYEMSLSLPEGAGKQI